MVFPIFCCSYIFETIIWYIRMRFCRFSQSGQTVHLCAYVCVCVCMCAYVFTCMYVCMCTYVCMYLYFVRRFVALVNLEPCSGIFEWDPLASSKSPNILICIHIIFHIFKIWNYDRVLNNIFKCPNNIFRYFVGFLISRIYFRIFEWDFVGCRKLAKLFMCEIMCAYLCDVCICLYICVCMCVCADMCVCICIFSDALFLLEFRDQVSIYSNVILSHLAKWPNISICIHTSFHIHNFKLWTCFK